MRRTLDSALVQVAISDRLVINRSINVLVRSEKSLPQKNVRERQEANGSAGADQAYPHQAGARRAFRSAHHGESRDVVLDPVSVCARRLRVQSECS